MMRPPDADTQAEEVTRLLGALAPDPVDQRDARRAFSQFKSRIAHERRDEFTMFGLKISKKGWRGLAAGLAVVALLSLLAIPQVEALASGFLSVFRVERFVLVNVSQERMDQIQKAMGDSSGFGPQETVKDGGEPRDAASFDEAASLAGFRPLVADASYGDPTNIKVTGESVRRYRPDVQSLRAVYSKLNLDPELIPANIDGQPFEVTAPAGIMATYAAGGKDMMFLQIPSPTVKVPDGVDMEKLGEAMLQLLGMTPDQAARMSKSIDWTSTLVVPVPQNLNSVREVTVRGVTGMLYQGDFTPDAKESGTGSPQFTVNLVWQDGGHLYSVQGTNVNQVTAFAEALR